MIRSYKSNSLVITVIISLVLAITCSSAILLALYNRQEQVKDNVQQKLQRNLESATNLVLADSAIYIAPVFDSLDLFDETKDSVIIKKEFWGLFQMASIRATSNNFSKQKNFFYGETVPDYMDGCLYVADHSRPIAVVGDTKLIGDAYLSRSGIKTSYIDQRGFNNNKLIEGMIKKSEDSLPGLRGNCLSNLYRLLKGGQALYSQNIPDSLDKSFTDSAFSFYKNEKITLRNCFLNGHVLIKSDSAIEIEPSARLNNIILVAPSIHFKAGVTAATVQAFATDSLIVEKGCSFQYPSILLLLKMNNSNLQNRMVIGNDCEINGELISVCNNSDLYKTSVEIGKNTKINGIIYTMGFLTLKGIVNGTVMTDFFIYKSPSTIYENYLVDITINREQLSEFFLVPAIFKGSTSQEIVQWVK
jgi:hypothetical protein